MVERSMTTVRFSEEDREIIAKLQDLTGLDTAVSVLRLAIREALAARGKRATKR